MGFEEMDREDEPDGQQGLVAVMIVATLISHPGRTGEELREPEQEARGADDRDPQNTAK